MMPLLMQVKINPYRLKYFILPGFQKNGTGYVKIITGQVQSDA